MMKHNNQHFRELPSQLFQEQRLPLRFHFFFEELVLPHLKFKGYKLKEKIRIAMHAINMLIKTGLRDMCVGDSRGRSKAGADNRVAAWDAIVKAGFSKYCPGSEKSGKVTRYRATPKLLDLKREWELPLLEDLHLRRNTELDIPVHHSLVVLHSGKKDRLGKLLPVDDQKQLIPFADAVETLAERDGDGKVYPEAVKNGLNYWRAVEDEIERFNRSNTRHGFQVFTVRGHEALGPSQEPTLLRAEEGEAAPGA